MVATAYGNSPPRLNATINRPFTIYSTGASIPFASTLDADSRSVGLHPAGFLPFQRLGPLLVVTALMQS